MQIHVILLTILLLVVNIYGAISLEQEFDPDWMLPSDSYASKFLKTFKTYYPEDGIEVFMFTGECPCILDIKAKVHHCMTLFCI